MRNIPKKEDLFTEFKSDTKEKNGLPDSELIDAVVGMTNAEGGILYVGVEDDGEIKKRSTDHLLKDIGGYSVDFDGTNGTLELKLGK